MSVILVERNFDTPQVVAELQAIEDDHAWCLDMHNVTFSHTYCSADRKRMVCVYEAPDAESVRIAQRKAGLPFDRVWAAASFSRMTSLQHDPAEPIVVTTRTFPMIPTEAQATEMIRSSEWCLETNRVRPVSSYFEDRGQRGLCVYVCPDLESARRANHTARLPFDSVWRGELMIPPG